MAVDPHPAPRTEAFHLRFLRAFIGNRGYARYAAGNADSQFGTWFQNTALYWLVLSTTHSPAMLGVLTLCLYGPVLSFGLLGGSVADRFGAGPTLFVAQAGLMVCAGLLAALTGAGSLSLGPILVITVFRGLLLCVSGPARRAFLVEVVAKQDLASAVSLNTSARNLARIAGPALAGIGIELVGLWPCFAINALSYVGVLIAIWSVTRRASRTHRTAGRGRGARELFQGLIYVWEMAHLRFLAICLAAVSFLSISFSTLVPIVAYQAFPGKPAVFGLLSASLGVGTLLGAMYAGSRIEQRLSLIAWSCIGLGLAEFGLAASAGIYAAVVLILLAGFVMICLLNTSGSIFLLDTPNELQGRVGAVYNYITGAISPLGSALSAWLAQVGGTGLAFALGAGVAVAFGLVGLAKMAALNRERGAGRGSLESGFGDSRPVGS